MWNLLVILNLHKANCTVRHFETRVDRIALRARINLLNIEGIYTTLSLRYKKNVETREMNRKSGGQMEGGFFHSKMIRAEGRHKLMNIVIPMVLKVCR